MRNGTYNNLVLPGDYSDLDCIRVGSDYYAITSTFQYSPGVAILHSKDLVNWSIVGHAVSDVTQIASRFNWSSMNGYARGVWAGAIRYHDGKFWVYFGTPDEGYFMTTATDPAGPWEPLHRMLAQSGWDDCCPFWDDDGQGYFVGTHISDNYKTWLYKLTADGRDLVPGSESTATPSLNDYDQPAPPAPPVSRVVSLVLRYSFSETSGTTVADSVADSVGGSAWNGTLPNGGTLGGGRVQMKAASSQYVKLPAAILSDYAAVTIDAWVTFPSTLPTNGFFFGFGNISGTSGSSYIFCQPRTSRLAITPSNYTAEQSTTPNPSGNWSNQTNMHVTAVFDPT
jgi:hypothetical protein